MSNRETKKIKKSLTTAICMLVFCSLLPEVNASPQSLFGFGGKSAALAGTGGATVNDFSAVYLNPAGLGHVQGKRFNFGVLYGDFFLKLDGKKHALRSASGATLGGAFSLPLGKNWKDRIGIGIGFYIPFKSLSRVYAPFAGEPLFALLESRAEMVALQFGVGMKWNEYLRFGVGGSALAEMHGGVDVTTDTVGRFLSQSEQQLVTKLAPIVGIQYTKNQWRAGLTIRDEIFSGFRILVTNDLQDALGVAIPVLTIQGVPQYDPRSAELEVAYHASAKWTHFVHLAYQQWSAFPTPTINPVQGGVPLTPSGFHDTVVPRVATEWSVHSRLKIRAGYAFHYSPAPTETKDHALLDNHRHLTSVGVGFDNPWDLPLHIHIWAQGHFLMKREHTKDLTEVEDPSNVVFERVTSAGKIFVGGFTLGVEL